MEGSALLFVIVIGAAVVLGVILSIRKAKRQANQNTADGVISKLEIPGGALRLTPTELIVGYGPNSSRHPVAGLVARVEDSGTVNRRLTVTRMVTLGVFAAALLKKIDDRELYLSVEGPDTAIVRRIDVRRFPAIGEKARLFAMQVNQRSGVSAKDE